MAKKPEPPKPLSWKIYKIAAKAVWIGEVEAPNEAAAIEKAAAESRVPATKLMAIRRWPAAKAKSRAMISRANGLDCG